jgi:hypothetical protein
MAEKPESKKFNHGEVGYEFPSTHPNERCGNCENFIPATDKTPPACKGVQRPIQIQAWCHRWETSGTEKNMAEKKEEHKAKHAHHGFTETHMKHHHDGSITVHHMHSEGPHKDVEHAVADLDGAHDSMQQHLGMPNPGEAEADAGSEAAAAGAAPAAAAAPPAAAGM